MSKPGNKRHEEFTEFLQRLNSAKSQQGDSEGGEIHGLADEVFDADDSQIEQLVAMHRLINQPQTFQVGDLVEWKPRLKNRQLPLAGQPAIVTQVLSEPVFDKSETGQSAGTPLFREPLDLKLGFFRGANFLEYHFDGRRMRHVRPSHE